MQIQLPYSVVYTTDSEVPLAIVAKNLLAHEALIKETVKIIDRVYPQVQVSLQSVIVRSVSQESPLKEFLLVGMFLTFQENLESEVPDLVEKITGIDVPDSADTLITVLVVMIASYIASNAIDRIFPGKDTKMLRQSYERKIEMLSENHGIDATKIDAYLENEYRKEQPKSLVRRVAAFFKPAMVDGNANIESPSGEILASWDAIREIPIELDTATPEGRSYPMEEVFVEVHRSDRDQNRYGWRAVIPAISSKKVRLELHHELAPQDLYGVESLKGDVAVREEPNTDGDMEPRVYYLNRISNEQH